MITWEVHNIFVLWRCKRCIVLNIWNTFANALLFYGQMQSAVFQVIVNDRNIPKRDMRHIPCCTQLRVVFDGMRCEGQFCTQVPSCWYRPGLQRVHSYLSEQTSQSPVWHSVIYSINQRQVLYTHIITRRYQSTNTTIFNIITTFINT